MPALRSFCRRPAALAALVGAVAAGVYAWTLAPAVCFGDAPELTMAALQLGVPHPPGYPLYTMLAHVFIRLAAFSDAAYRMNLLSAVLGGIAVAGVFRLCLEFCRARWCALCGALLYAFSTTFWAQATVAEVYTLHVALSVWSLWAMLSWQRAHRPRRGLLGCGIFGLSLAHNPSNVLTAPALVLAALTPKPGGIRRLNLALCAAAALAPLALYAYLPLAARRDPVMNWGDVTTLDHFVQHVTAKQYQYRLRLPQIETLVDRLRSYAVSRSEPVRPGYLFNDFSGAVLWLAPLGLYGLARRRRRLLGVTALAFGLPFAYAMCYDIPDLEVYFLIPHAIAACWMACGLRQVGAWVRRFLKSMEWRPRVRRWAFAVFALECVVVAGALAPGHIRPVTQAQKRGAGAFAEWALKAFEPNAVVIATGDDWSFPLLYAHYVEKRRPDLAILPAVNFLERNYRLTRRMRSPSLDVTDPDCARTAPNPDDHVWCRMRYVAQANLARRPVYLVGETVQKFLQSEPELARWPTFEQGRQSTPILRFRAEAGATARDVPAEAWEGHSR